MSCTVVTMFINLKKLPDSSSNTRSVDFYLKNGIGTLKIKNPMLIFCDSVSKPLIEKIRNEHVPVSIPTIYIERSLDDYDFYKWCHPIIVENRKGILSYIDSKVTPSYHLICMFKIIAIQIAHQRNDFNSSHYVWIDFGCSHMIGPTVEEDATKLLESPREKVAVCYIHYRSHQYLLDMKNACNKGICGIAGTIFSVEKSYVNRFFSSMWAIFYEMLSKGLGHCDEQVFTYCYDRHPELFTLYFGDYFSTLSNYHSPVRDIPSIMHYFIRSAMSAQRADLARDAAKAIYDLLIRDRISLPKNDIKYLEFILDL